MKAPPTKEPRGKAPATALEAKLRDDEALDGMLALYAAADSEAECKGLKGSIIGYIQSALESSPPDESLKALAEKVDRIIWKSGPVASSATMQRLRDEVKAAILASVIAQTKAAQGEPKEMKATE